MTNKTIGGLNTGSLPLQAGDEFAFQRGGITYKGELKNIITSLVKYIDPVLDWGLSANGTTDDFSKMQAGFDALTGGEIIDFGSNQFLLSAPIVVQDLNNITILGGYARGDISLPSGDYVSGGGLAFINTATTAMGAVFTGVNDSTANSIFVLGNCHNWLFRGGIYDSKNYDTSTNGINKAAIYTYNCSNIVTECIDFSGSSDGLIAVGSSSKEFIMDKVYNRGLVTWSQSAEDDKRINNGLFRNYSSAGDSAELNLKVTNSDVRNTWHHSIMVGGGYYAVSNCNAFNCTDSAFYSAGANYTSFIGCKSYRSGKDAFKVIKRSGTDTMPKGAIITGCHALDGFGWVKNDGGIGINIECDNFTISDCEIQLTNPASVQNPSEQRGISFYGRNPNISDVNIYGDTTVNVNGLNIGILINVADGNVDGSNIKDVKIDQVGTAIQASNTFTDSAYIDVSGITVTDCYNGMFFDNSGVARGSNVANRENIRPTVSVEDVTFKKIQNTALYMDSIKNPRIVGVKGVDFTGSANKRFLDIRNHEIFGHNIYVEGCTTDSSQSEFARVIKNDGVTREEPQHGYWANNFDGGRPACLYKDKPIGYYGANFKVPRRFMFERSKQFTDSVAITDSNGDTATVDVSIQLDFNVSDIIVTAAGGFADNQSRANSTNYKIGDYRTFSDNSVWRVDNTTISTITGDSDSTEPTISSTNIGDIITDNELKWQKVADGLATFGDVYSGLNNGTNV